MPGVPGAESAMRPVALLCTSPVAVARSSSDGAAIRTLCTSGSTHDVTFASNGQE